MVYLFDFLSRNLYHRTGSIVSPRLPRSECVPRNPIHARDVHVYRYDLGHEIQHAAFLFAAIRRPGHDGPPVQVRLSERMRGLLYGLICVWEKHVF